MEIDPIFMHRCLELAAKAFGNVAPNPMVGSVIVHQNAVIGEGYHEKYGAPHAEVNAINSVEDKTLLNDSTLYVSLEPCSHFGKTPPCVDLILQHKIPRVVIASTDPNPLVSGNGIKRLSIAGVEVAIGLLKDEADFLNRRFNVFHKHKRPYVLLKWAQSADGFIALSTAEQFWFTNDESKKLTHKWRTEEQAILVGKNTVMVDDCELTSRLWKGKNPTRMVIDKNLELNSAKKIFDTAAETVVFNAVKNDSNETNHFVKLDFSKSIIPQIFDYCYTVGFQSIIIEGGAFTLQQFLDTNQWDEARIFSTEHILSDGKRAPIISGKIHSTTRIGTDELTIYMNPKS
jgi:diaminohydroxyphosphoribosylaminopyrimidine deaminase/5-amino-6-(5-phosphoribosylamino)uracil reductase